MARADEVFLRVCCRRTGDGSCEEVFEGGRYLSRNRSRSAGASVRPSSAALRWKAALSAAFSFDITFEREGLESPAFRERKAT